MSEQKTTHYQIEHLPVDALIPYANNARKHSAEQVGQIAGSIKEFGFNNPVLVDRESGIIAGHGRVMAAKKLGMQEVPCIRLSHLTDTQRRAYILADNRLAEIGGGWDEELLKAELTGLLGEGVDISGLGWEDGWNDSDAIEPAYTRKIETPNYEPKGEKPEVLELFDDSKEKSLLEKINASGLPEEQKTFLKKAAQRHVVFNYEKIAEYYSHSEKQVQELMEDSALVIIDFNKAIELGYVKLTEEISTEYLKDNPNE